MTDTCRLAGQDWRADCQAWQARRAALSDARYPQQNRDALLGYTHAHYWKALLVAIAVYTAATAFSVPGGVLLSLATGFLFWRWVGTGVIVISATVGAALVILAARYLFADAMRAGLGGKLREMSEGFAREGFNFLLFLRLVPVLAKKRHAQKEG